MYAETRTAIPAVLCVFAVLALAVPTGAVAAEAEPAAAAADAAKVEFFEKKIRPVLVEHCYECHSVEAAKAGKLQGKLAIDSRAGVRQGGESGPAVMPGDVAASTIIKALRHEGLEMPPGEKLPEDVVADFVTWVKDGAIDPREGNAVASAAIDIERGRTFWSFVPPVAHPRPAVRDAAWPAKELDWFIRATHEAKGVTPVAAATREEWLRRVTFDLTGLPPSPEEVDAFVADQSSEAFATVVDRLLASPQFGERWARHWLDVARYTNELNGAVNPDKQLNSFRYRDWVVNAFNADMPYDQFVRLQLAGDLLAEPKDDAVTRLAGLGFQGLGLKLGNPAGMQKKVIADELDDRVDTLTRGLLGLTVSCARCHDHKFDPIPTRDYYALAAAYNGSDWRAELQLSPEQEQARNDWLNRKAELDAPVKKLLDEEVHRVGRAELAKLAAYLEAAWRAEVLAARKLSPDVPALAKQHGLVPAILDRLTKAVGQKKKIEAAGDVLKAWQAAVVAAVPAAAAGEGDVAVPPEIGAAAKRAAATVAEAVADLDRLDREKQEKKPKPEPLRPEHALPLEFLFTGKAGVFKLDPKDIPALFTAEAKQRHESLARELAEHAKREPLEPPRAIGVTGGGKPMHINIRGNADQLGVMAPPGFLQVLSRPAASGTAAAAFTRLDLADAIATRDNPLTARVFVNRVWHHLFGRGLVGTPSNFGQLGERPSHPELLDTLAVRFMEQGWSAKWLIREITLSATYRLSSRPDAANQRLDGDNQLLWRMTPRRLDFEAWRDAMLAVAGKLDLALGGPPWFGNNPKKDREISPQDPSHGRRTLYCFISRRDPNPTLTLFDVPEPSATSEGRAVTTSPQQQLFALNSGFVVEMSKAFAERLGKEAADDAARIDRAWKLAFARSPSPEERQAVIDYLQATANGWPQVCHAILLGNEFLFLP
jgi:cytochrome c553